jgi:prevent-host-death family protein
MDESVRRVSITEARRQLSRLLREVGRGRSVEILRRGQVVARLIPAQTGLGSTADVILALRARMRRHTARADAIAAYESRFGTISAAEMEAQERADAKDSRRRGGPQPPLSSKTPPQTMRSPRESQP